MFHDIIGTTDQPYQVKFTVGAEPWRFRKVKLVITKDGEQQVRYPLKWERYNGREDVWSVTLAYMTTGLYFYHFLVNDVEVIGHDKDYFCVSGGSDYQLTIFEPTYESPKWLEGGIIYQIMVDRFCAVDPVKRADAVYHGDWYETPAYLPVNGKILNNDFYGGNLKGIISKLDYLDSLCVTCIYLNPIFKANSNHKYDTADYLQVDPSFGTTEDLKELIDRAAERGMAVILDGVFSHTGDDSIYFNKYGNYPSVGAYQSKSSPYYKWYKFANHPDRYDSWWGIDTLPEVNETETSYQEFITGEEGVVAHWLRLGVAGWRLDVADELPDTFIAAIAKRAKSVKKDALVLGEVWEDASNKVAYSVRRKYFMGEELDSVTNYVFRSAIYSFLKTGDAGMIARTVQTVIYHYPPRVLHTLMNIVGTHDTPRMLTMLSDADGHAMTRTARAESVLTNEEYEKARKKLYLAAVLLYTLPGVPCVFYGDEAGLQGFEDPFNRRTYPWGKEDGKILDFYRKLGALRRTSPELKKGSYTCLSAAGNVYIFRRAEHDRQMIVGINLGATPFADNLGNAMFDAFSGEECTVMSIPPLGATVLVNERR